MRALRASVVVLFCQIPLLAGAQDERASSFEAVEGAVQEDIAGAPLLLAAYAAIWIMVFAYVIRLVRLQTRSASDLERLQASLKREGGHGDGG